MESKLVSDDAAAAHPFSIERHTICCDQIIKEGTKHPSLLKTHSNFIQNGPPHRVLLHENGEWVDFLEENDIGVVEEIFTAIKTVLFRVEFRGSPYVADFLHMILIDLKTCSQRPIGWMNKAGKCFFPTNFDFHDCFRLKRGNEISRIGESSEAPARKRIKRSKAMEDIGGNKGLRALPQKIIERFLTYEEKQHFYLNKDCIVGIKGLSDYQALARSRRFEKEVENIERSRGNANVRYAWLGTSKEAVSRILKDGIVLNDLSKGYPAYGIGVHLASACCSYISESYCDIDEKGLQYMVLCRVILGNTELVHPGSKQFSPSSKNFDSGVDDLDNPKRYIIWNNNMNTHIYPEYAVSFKSPSIEEGHPSDSRSKDAAWPAKNSTACQKKLHPYVYLVNSRGNCEQTSVPVGVSQQKDLTTKFAGPMFPLSRLLTEMEDKVPYSVMKVVYQLYEQLKKKKMNKYQLYQMMRLVVGDTLLRDSLISLRPKLG